MELSGSTYIHTHTHPHILTHARAHTHVSIRVDSSVQHHKGANGVFRYATDRQCLYVECSSKRPPNSVVRNLKL